MEEGHQNDIDRNQLKRSDRRQDNGKIILFSSIIITAVVEILIRDVCRILNHYPIIMITFARHTQFNIYLQYT